MNALKGYLKKLGTDYLNSLKEVCADGRSRPLKTGVILSALGGVFYANRTNPNELVLQERLAELRRQMVLIPAAIQNTRSTQKLDELTELLNKNRLDFYDCLLFSLVVRRNFDRKSCLYEAQDANLRDYWFVELWRNTIDVGAFNRFFLLERSFIDYDVREEEEEFIA